MERQRHRIAVIALVLAFTFPTGANAATLDNASILNILSGVLTTFSQMLATMSGGQSNTAAVSIPVSQSVAAGGNYAAPFAAAQRVDNLSNVTVHGVTGLTASDIPSLPYLPLSGGTVAGNLTVTGAFSGGSLNLSLASTTALVVQNATSTNFFSTNASTTNATSTNLFSSLGHFTTGIIDSLSAAAATITNLIVTTITGTNATFTNATTTNATTTNLAVTGQSYFGGNVGIGTTSPFTKLSVVGDGYISGNLTAHGLFSQLNSGALTIGTGNSANYGSAVELQSVVAGSSNAHGYADHTLFTSTAAGNAYASYSANANIAGTLNYNHYAGFQSAPSITTSGTTNTLYGYYAAPNISNGTVSNNNEFACGDAILSAGGLVTNNICLYIGQMANGANNYSIYSVGTEPAYFNGPVQTANISPQGSGLNLNIPSGSYWAAVQGAYDLSWGSQSSGLLTIGSRNSTGSLWMNTPSYNGSNDSGFGVNGSFNSGTNVTTVNVGAYGVKSGGGFSSVLNFLTTSNTSTTTAMTISGVGKVGIGTTAPPNKLSVVDTNIAQTTADSGNLYVYTTDTAAIDKGGSIAFGGSYTGTTRYGFASVSGRKENVTDGNAAGYLAFATYKQGVGIAERMRIDSSGNVGIATTTPWRTLSVTGTVGFDGLTGNFGAGSLCLTANKEVVYNSGSDSCLSSLRATKHGITPLSVDAFSQIAALQPVSFVYNSDASSTVRYGFIAEDTAAVDPHLATYDAQGAISGIDDRSVVALTVRAVQSLISTISAFADRFTTRELTFTRASGDEITVRKASVQELCVGTTCLTESQVQALLNLAGQQPSAPSEPAPSESSDASSTPDIIGAPLIVPDEPTATSTAF